MLDTDEDFHLSTATGLRFALRELEDLPDAIMTALLPVRQAQRMGGSPHYSTLARVCRDAYLNAGRTVARTIIQMKGDRSANRRPELQRALRHLQQVVLDQFDLNDGLPLFRSPSAERAELASTLERDAEGILLDFDVGIIPMKQTSGSTDNSIQVNAGDGSNVSVAGARAELKMGDQSVSYGHSESALLAALEQLAEIVAASNVPVTDRDAAEDALKLVKVELEGKRDPGRLKRHLATAGDFANRVGASAIGGTIASYISQAL